MSDTRRAYTRAETETIIRRSDDERFWDIYSGCPRDIRRIRKSVVAFGGEIKEGKDRSIRAKLPLKALTFRAAVMALRRGAFGRALKDDRDDI